MRRHYESSQSRAHTGDRLKEGLLHIPPSRPFGGWTDISSGRTEAPPEPRSQSMPLSFSVSLFFQVGNQAQSEAPGSKELNLFGMGGGAGSELVPAGKLHPGLGQRIQAEMGRKDGNSSQPCSYPPRSNRSLCVLCSLEKQLVPSNPGLPAPTTSGLSDLRPKARLWENQD